MQAAKLFMSGFCDDFAFANKHGTDHGVDAGIAAGAGGEGEAAVDVLHMNLHHRCLAKSIGLIFMSRKILRKVPMLSDLFPWTGTLMCNSFFQDNDDFRECVSEKKPLSLKETNHFHSRNSRKFRHETSPQVSNSQTGPWRANANVRGHRPYQMFQCIP